MTVLLGLGLALPVAAQQRVNNGNALDANPQAGSGGSNPYGQQLDFRVRNNVVTGDVANSRAFRGDIDYGSVGSFRGTLGSDDLFRFRADALTSSPNVRDVIGQTYAGQRGTVSVFRNFTDLRTEYAIGAAPPGRTAAEDAGIRRYSDRLQTLNNDTIRLSDLGTSGDDTNTSGRLGVFRDAQGQALELTASPLLGIRENPLNISDDFTRRAQRLQDTTDDGMDEGENAQDPTDPSASGTGLETGQRVGEPIDGRLMQPETPGQGGDRPLGAPAGLVLGQQLQSQIQPDRGEQTYDQQIAALRRQLYAPLERQGQPGEPEAGQEAADDPYLALLAQMRGEQPDAQQQGNEEPNERVRRLQDILQGPDGGELQALENQRDDAVRRAYANDRLARLNRLSDRQQVEDPISMLQEAGEGDVLSRLTLDDRGLPRTSSTRGTDALLGELSTQLPRVQSLAGQQPQRMNQLLRQAESQLAAGDWFAAENTYRQALLQSRSSPLARVGLAHAQLGAGLIRSSAYNLRTLFENNPELINVRYEPRLLPGGDRLQFIQQELQSQISDGARENPEPGLMLAYLGFQAESRPLIRYGLAAAETAAPRDTLLPVLRRVWLSDGEAPQGPANARERQAPRDQPPAPQPPEPRPQPTPAPVPPPTPAPAPGDPPMPDMPGAPEPPDAPEAPGTPEAPDAPQPPRPAPEPGQPAEPDMPNSQAPQPSQNEPPPADDDSFK
jgi:hypothetical protein